MPAPTLRSARLRRELLDYELDAAVKQPSEALVGVMEKVTCCAAVPALTMPHSTLLGSSPEQDVPEVPLNLAFSNMFGAFPFVTVMQVGSVVLRGRSRQAHVPGEGGAALAPEIALPKVIVVRMPSESACTKKLFMFPVQTSGKLVASASRVTATAPQPRIPIRTTIQNLLIGVMTPSSPYKRFPRVPLFSR